MTISSISLYDFATITAYWNTVMFDRFKCNKYIEERIENQRWNSEEAKKIAIDKYRTINGCGLISEKIRYESDGLGFHQCFCSYNNPRINLYVTWLVLAQQGLLPFEGAINDQPAYVFEILMLMQKFQAEAQEQDNKKRQEKQKHGKK